MRRTAAFSHSPAYFRNPGVKGSLRRLRPPLTPKFRFTIVHRSTEFPGGANSDKKAVAPRNNLRRNTITAAGVETVEYVTQHKRTKGHSIYDASRRAGRLIVLPL
jgi:hypothetical protein